jgi:hypothetical protein
MMSFKAGLYRKRGVSSIGNSPQSTAFGRDLPQRSILACIDPDAGFWFVLTNRLYGIDGIEFPAGGRAMTSMKDREEGFERKFAFDEELRFRATARRNKLLGLWAAEKLGKSGADADAYAKEVVVSDIEEAGDHDVLRKVKADFEAAGVDQSEHQIRRTMDELMAQAIEQVRNS